MKKNLCILLFLTTPVIFIHAQNSQLLKNQYLKSIIKSSPHAVAVSKSTEPSVPLNTSAFPQNMLRTRAGGDMVGTTTYDLPTNASAPSRLLVNNDGSVSAAWTGSTSLSDTHPDRGTFYNHFDGTNWGASPSERIEDIRTGFPTMVSVDGKEIFFCHDGNNNIIIYDADAGSGNFTEDPNSMTLHGTWPRAAVAEGSSTIHLIVANDSPDEADPNDFILYYRSTNAGASWDVQAYRLPGIDTADGYSKMGAENYAIYARGTTVYIVAGAMINDLAVWKSTSNGDPGTWVRTRIMQVPVPNLDGVTLTDIDGDGNADTLVTHDGCPALLIDNEGMMHVWCGVTYLLDDDLADKSWSYFPGVAGMWYWNESFGADSVQYLDFTLVDWDNDGDPFAGIGGSLPSYQCGFDSQISVAHDPATDNMYIVYTQPVEYTDYYGDPGLDQAQSFRDIFGFYTTDRGETWSDPVNITYLAEQQYENVSPEAFVNTIDNKVHVMWMQDQEPGNSLENLSPGEPQDPIGTNDMLYRAFDFSRFDPYPPTVDFDFTITGNIVHFINLTTDASTYSWNFNDTGGSTAKDPDHTFTTLGDYNVCLTAANVYEPTVGDVQVCKTVSITALAVTDQQLQNSIKIYPTLASDKINISVNGIDAATLFVSIYNLQGQKIYTEPLTGDITSVDVSGFASGNYLVKISDGSAMYHGQFSIIK